VPDLDGSNQCAATLASAPQPIDCTKRFTIQKARNIAKLLLAPNARVASTDNTMPAMNEARPPRKSPQTPVKALPIAYARMPADPTTPTPARSTPCPLSWEPSSGATTDRLDRQT